jgi:hypothetical protein
MLPLVSYYVLLLGSLHRGWGLCDAAVASWVGNMCVCAKPKPHASIMPQAFLFYLGHTPFQPRSYGRCWAGQGGVGV